MRRLCDSHCNLIQSTFKYNSNPAKSVPHPSYVLAQDNSIYSSFETDMNGAYKLMIINVHFVIFCIVDYNKSL